MELGVEEQRSETNDHRHEKYRRMAHGLLPGFAFNPLTRYPRNKGCVCGSGEKFKRCCLPKIRPAVKREVADEINANWDRILTGHITLKQPAIGQGHNGRTELPAVRWKDASLPSVPGASSGLPVREGAAPMPALHERT